MHRYDEAEEVFRGVLNSQPGNAEFYAVYGSAMQTIGRYEAAIKAYRKAIDMRNPRPTEVYENLLSGPAKIVTSFLDFREIKDLGPAVYIDAGKYVTRRAKDGITKSRALYEVLYAYFLPQFEGMSDEDASELYRMVEPLLDPPEAIEAHRSISQLLGVELVV